jgi:hypothetical protein
MSSLQYLAAIGAVLVAFWPQIKQAGGWLSSRAAAPLPSVSPSRPIPSYSDAIGDLASVRLRLLGTGVLDEEQRKAIDVLTLALVDGSDR